MNKRIIYIAIILGLSFQFSNSQCFPDRHSTSWFDGWISCNTTTNPNVAYGNSHWIMYDLGYEYTLKTTKLWNANEPTQLDNGIKDYTIDYSLDGTNWINLGTFTADQATGLSTYEGIEGPDFNSTAARYVLITPTSNYGGSCFGFSELKINIADPLDIIDEEDGFNAMVFPNPFVDDVNIRIASLFEDQPLTYTLYDLLGRQITQNVINLTTDQDVYEIDINAGNLSAGIYILNVEQNNKIRTFKLIKK